MFYLTRLAFQDSKEAQGTAQQQRRVKGSMCRILLAHQLVNTGRLTREDGALLMAHKGGRVKRK